MSLHSLRSKRDLKLLDTIDELRSQGISQFVSLPQIIVCGDQSSGKSSVLEAISGVPFPSKSNLCTRFPTELILRKHAVEKTEVSIVPHPECSRHEKQRMAEFSATLADVQQLPALIERAKNAMGLNAGSSAFSKHTLRVETSGPKLPHLTIVDLPGLIHSANKKQTIGDVAVIRTVVEQYMLEPRSIILAVISAKNDYANQIVLNMAREVDKTGTRTLGVITKPDTLHPKSETERTYINLARNKEVQFGHGWHVVKNLDTDKGIAGLEERHAKEKDFFATGSWAALHDSLKGIDSLRRKLSVVLFQQISTQLPTLVEEISSKKKACENDLARLGEPRAEPWQQRKYLAQCAATFQNLLNAALQGNYDDPFFENNSSGNSYDKRIRAIIQNKLTEFAEGLNEHGRLHRVVTSSRENNSTGSELLVTESEMIESISKQMLGSRGRELPGMFNPSVISDLFRQESRLWEDITLSQVVVLWTDVKAALRQISCHCADASTARFVFENVIMPELSKCLEKMRNKVSELLKSHRSVHAITYNQYYTETLQKNRVERYTRQFTTVIRQEFGTGTGNRPEEFVARLARTLATSQETSSADFTAVEALDMLNAYYKVVLKRFIDQMATEVVEICFLQNLFDIFTPTMVAGMEERLVTRLASETQECITTRQELNQQIELFKQGEDTCNRFIQLREPELDSEADDESGDDNSANSDEQLKDEDATERESVLLPSPPPTRQRKRRNASEPGANTGTPTKKSRVRGSTVT